MRLGPGKVWVQEAEKISGWVQAAERFERRDPLWMKELGNGSRALESLIKIPRNEEGKPRYMMIYRGFPCIYQKMNDAIVIKVKKT